MAAMTLSPHHPFKSARARDAYLALYDRRAERWPVVSEAMMIETSYGQTYVRASGPLHGPPLVLLHGAGGNALQWMPNIEALSLRFRTYTPDNIVDFGRSVNTGTLRRPDDFTGWLDELFNALMPGDHINLTGLSFGGWLATQYALRFPGRLARMVLLAPACSILPLSWRFIIRAMLCIIPHRHFTKSFLTWLLEDLAKKDAAGRTLVDEQIEESYLALRSFKVRPLIHPTVLTDRQWQSIKVPTLFLIGENEKIYDARKALHRLSHIAPQIKTGLIPGAGHDLTVVQAKMVNSRILAFLDQNGP